MGEPGKARGRSTFEIEMDTASRVKDLIPLQGGEVRWLAWANQKGHPALLVGDHTGTYLVTVERLTSAVSGVVVRAEEVRDGV